jgi:hypothetical protein
MDSKFQYAVEEVVEASDAGESESDAAAPAVSAAGADGDNVETQVADEIVEQALDAVRLLARDPRYTEAIHRRLKALK